LGVGGCGRRWGMACFVSGLNMHAVRARCSNAWGQHTTPTNRSHLLAMASRKDVLPHLVVRQVSQGGGVRRCGHSVVGTQAGSACCHCGAAHSSSWLQVEHRHSSLCHSPVLAQQAVAAPDGQLNGAVLQTNSAQRCGRVGVCAALAAPSHERLGSHEKLCLSLTPG
jgi:hypothetical protein